jgi:hypothetical protein
LMIFNSENSLILRILIQTKCHKIPGSVLIIQATEIATIVRDGHYFDW